MPVDFLKKVSRSEAGVQAVQLRYQGSDDRVVIEIEARLGFLGRPSGQEKTDSHEPLGRPREADLLR
jgi:hypothetical protein